MDSIFKQPYLVHRVDRSEEIEPTRTLERANFMSRAQDLILVKHRTITGRGKFDSIITLKHFNSDFKVEQIKRE